MNPVGRCGACGFLLMGHICIETAHVEGRRPEAVVLKTPYVFGSHEDRAADFVADLEVFSRRAFSEATAYGRLSRPAKTSRRC